MVVIDDIWHWEEWQVIRKALPNNNLGCKLIMTTRLESIAEKCASQRGAVVYKPQYYDHVLGDGFLSTPSWHPLVQSLSLGFDDLPVQLRTCLLYCTVYPPWYRIDRVCLVRKWVAEGFASQVEIAYSYLDKLVSRNLLLRKLFLYVHPMMRASLPHLQSQGR
jgi:hypothetical protein